MDEFIIADRRFRPRLVVGTAKFSSNKAMLDAMEASGSEIITVALRRVDIEKALDYMLKHTNGLKYLLFSNPSGARDAEEAAWINRAPAFLERAS